MKLFVKSSQKKSRNKKIPIPYSPKYFKISSSKKRKEWLSLLLKIKDIKN